MLKTKKDAFVKLGRFMEDKELKTFHKKYSEPFGKNRAWNDRKTKQIDPQNLILSDSVALTTVASHSGMNNNAVIFGRPDDASAFMKANLLQANSSYVVNDPTGELCLTTGNFFKDCGYSVKVLNLVDAERSDRYNPFVYLMDDNDVHDFVKCLIEGTGGERKAGEAELLEAIILFILGHRDEDLHTFASVATCLRAAKDDLRKAKSNLDVVFDGIRAKNPFDICVKRYDVYKLLSRNAAMEAAASAASRIAPFDTEAMNRLTEVDEMELMLIRENPTVIYVIAQEKNGYIPLANMLYMQLLNALHMDASVKNFVDEEIWPVRFMMNDFSSIGYIPGLTSKIDDMSMYDVSCMMHVHSLEEIKTVYKDEWSKIVNACDIMEYFGSNDLETVEFISKHVNVTPDKSLFSAVRRLKKDKCIVILKGQHPVFDKRYSLKSHIDYASLGDLPSGKNLFEMPHISDPTEEEAFGGTDNSVRIDDAFEPESHVAEDEAKLVIREVINISPEKKEIILDGPEIVRDGDASLEKKVVKPKKKKKDDKATNDVEAVESSEDGKMSEEVPGNTDVLA